MCVYKHIDRYYVCIYINTLHDHLWIFPIFGFTAPPSPKSCPPHPSMGSLNADGKFQWFKVV